MFTKIQKYLLINHPLLWNTKIVPALSFAVLFHILFFVIGYVYGNVDFTDENYYLSDFSTGVIIFFSILITILFFVVWFVYYFRNNAYKSLYRLSNLYLYKEWLIIFLVCFLNITYSISFLSGKTLKERSYYSKEEVDKRGRTILMASVFIDGSYDYENVAVADSVGKIVFNKKKYQQNSLMNKSFDYYYGSFTETNNDEIKVKTWMQNDNQAEIKKLMNDYFLLIKEHNLKTNLTANQWFELTYNYPDFTNYERIGRRMEDVTEFFKDNANQNIYKYYLPQNALISSYSQLSKAWNDPIIETGTLLILLYVSIAMAMLVYAFKVTTGRNWLIALVSIGILWIITGILAAITNSEIVFMCFWLSIILLSSIYFFSVISNNKGKNFSGIALNLILWSISGFLPLIFGLVSEYYNNPKSIVVAGQIKHTNTPQYEWLNDNATLLSWINILIIMAIMYFISIYIKKWKALAES